jgi:hypothetical protein
MSTSKLDRSPELESQDTDEPDVVNHYVPRSMILLSIVTGQAVTALCGETYVVESQGGGKVESGEVVCWDCDFLYMQLSD